MKELQLLGNSGILLPQPFRLYSSLCAPDNFNFKMLKCPAQAFPLTVTGYILKQFALETFHRRQ